MSATDYKFEGKLFSTFPSRSSESIIDERPSTTGWGAFGPDSVEGNFKKFEYEPKTFQETDVDSESCRGALGDTGRGH